MPRTTRGENQRHSTKQARIRLLCVQHAPEFYLEPRQTKQSRKLWTIAQYSKSAYYSVLL